MSCGIYKWDDGNRVYIGQSINIERRQKAHINSALRGVITPLYEAMRHHLEDFSFEILEECSSEELNDKEKYYISLYDCQIPKGFNQTAGGSGSGHFVKLNVEILDKIIYDLINTDIPITELAQKYELSHQMIYDIKNGHSWCRDGLQYPLREISKKEKVFKTDVNKRSDAARKQNKLWVNFSDNFIQILDDVVENGVEATAIKYGVSRKSVIHYFTYFNIDYHRSALKELYNKIHNILKRKITKTNYQGTKGKRVYQLNKENEEIINIFNSCADAARYLGDYNYNKHISEVCSGSRKSAYGFKWRYGD